MATSRYDPTLALMKEKGTFLVPTYSTLIDLIEPGGDYDNPVVHNRGLHMLPRARRMIQQARQMGIRIVTGADSSYGPESLTRISMEIARVSPPSKPKLSIVCASASGADQCDTIRSISRNFRRSNVLS